jgi:hypothetical protein
MLDLCFKAWNKNVLFASGKEQITEKTRSGGVTIKE